MFDKSVLSVQLHTNCRGVDNEQSGRLEPRQRGAESRQQLPMVVAELFKAIGKTLEHERESAVEYIERATAMLSVHSPRAMSNASAPPLSNGVKPIIAKIQQPQIRTPTECVDTHTVQASLDEIYVNAIAVATATRLICTYTRGVLTTEGSRNGLQKWRLMRVINHIDTHLAETITLADMAKVAGLTRMHFARQFKAATGIRPHEYLLRRRIDSAKELLGNWRLKLVDVALGVGFQTQPHFTTVFKRYVGQTPHQWRTSVAGCAQIAGPTRELGNAIPWQPSLSQPERSGPKRSSSSNLSSTPSDEDRRRAISE